MHRIYIEEFCRDRSFFSQELYIQGLEEQLNAIKNMLYLTANNMGGQTEDESALYIPVGLVMQVLVGDGMHLGVIVGMNTEDPYCVVLRIEMDDELVLRDALLECFKGIEIEVVEDVYDEPWPFE
jgi:hypothetical protein